MLARGKKKKVKWEYFVTNSLIFKNKIHQLFKEKAIWRENFATF
jgi:hypothetical protein